MSTLVRKIRKPIGAILLIWILYSSRANMPLMHKVAWHLLNHIEFVARFTQRPEHCLRSGSPNPIEKRRAANMERVSLSASRLLFSRMSFVLARLELYFSPSTSPSPSTFKPTSSDVSYASGSSSSIPLVLP